MTRAALRVVSDDDIDTTPSGLPRCTGRKADGSRCKAFAGKAGTCYWHDERVSDAQKAKTRTLAGRSSAKWRRAQRLMPPRLRPVFDDLMQAMEDLKAGRMFAKEATALASLATASVRVLEAGEIEERLRSLEESSADADDTPPPMGYGDE